MRRVVAQAVAAATARFGEVAAPRRRPVTCGGLAAVAAEHPGAYAAQPGLLALPEDADVGGASGAGGGAVPGVVDAVEAIARAVEVLPDVDLDAADEASLRTAVQGVHRQTRRLQAFLSELAEQLTARQAARNNPTDPRDPRARQRAELETQRELADTLRISHSEAKRTTKAGGQLTRHAPAAGEAFRDGEISPEHATLLARTMRDLVGCGELERFEAQLLAAARTQDPTEFGRTCRRLTAQHAPARAERDLQRLNGRRYGNAAQGADGMLHVRAGWAGIDAEIAATAIETFRTPDAPGQHRSTEQRTADALLAALRRGLEHADSTAHGNRPHILVRIDWNDLLASTRRPDAHANANPDPDADGDGDGDGSADGDGVAVVGGVAETSFVGPLPAAELRRILDDSTITRILTGPDSQVIDVGRATRTVSGPTWRGLEARDGGCTLPGCDAPPSRCEAAHMDRRWVDGAGTSVHELALACRPGHLVIDRLGLTGRLVDGTVVWHWPDGTPYRRYGRTDLDGQPPERS